MVSDLGIIYIATGVGIITKARDRSRVFGDLMLMFWGIMGLYFSTVSGGTYDPAIPLWTALCCGLFAITDLLMTLHERSMNVEH